MKSFILFCLMACMLPISQSFAQKMPGLDKSPADLAFLREDGVVKARVIYSRPQANDREVFGNLVKYDKVWRLGANEATEIEFFADAKVGGESIAKGAYALFAIPGKDKWTFILNSERFQWGAYRYNADADVARFEVKAKEIEDAVEAFTITFAKGDDGQHMVVAWENTKVSIPISF